VLAQRFGWVKEMLGLGNVNAAFGVGDAAEFGQFFALGFSESVTLLSLVSFLRLVCP